MIDSNEYNHDRRMEHIDRIKKVKELANKMTTGDYYYLKAMLGCKKCVEYMEKIKKGE